MSSSANESPFHPSVRLDRLCEIVEILEAVHHSDPDRPSSLIRLGDLGGAEIKLAMLPMVGHGLHDQLLGVVTPDRWEAVGLVAHGTAWVLASGEPVDPTGVGGLVGNTTVAVVCTRWGETATAVRFGHDDPIIRVDFAGPGDHGCLVDLLRRSFGLPTAPPAVEVDSLRVDVWLQRVYTVAIEAVSVDQEMIDALTPSPLSDWSTLREQVARGEWDEIGIDPQLADWMDDGLLCRWVMGAFPEPVEILIELADLLAPAVLSHLVAGLAQAWAGLDVHR